MRILLGFILALSVSFACDQPYEEVGGYKIGCPFDDKSGFILDKSKAKDGISVYKSKLKNSFFQEVSVEVINGNIEGVSFDKKYHDDDSSFLDDEDVLLATLKERWGEFVAIDISRYNKIYSFRNTNSEVIDRVSVFRFVNGPTAIISLNYYSKNQSKHYELIIDNEKSKKQDQLTNF